MHSPGQQTVFPLFTKLLDQGIEADGGVGVHTQRLEGPHKGVIVNVAQKELILALLLSATKLISRYLSTISSEMFFESSVLQTLLM